MDLFIKKVEKVKLGNPMDDKTVVGPLIRNTEVLRVNDWVQESKENGADLILGGKILSESTYDKTIIVNPKVNDKVSRFEVFGPVVTINEYDHFDQAINDANSVDVSFQASIFTDRINELLKFYQKINASSVFHNDHTAFRVDWMPFAGLKHSGHGVGGIKYSMEDMQIEKMLVLRK